MKSLSFRIVLALVFCMGISLSAYAQSANGKSKVAIYSTIGNGINSDFKDAINSYFVVGITNSRDYVVVERNDEFIAAMSQEGAYATEDVVKVGKEFKADFVVVIGLTKPLGDEYLLATRLIDVNVQNGNVIKAYNTNGQVNTFSQLKALANDAVEGLLSSVSSGSVSSGNYNGHEYVDLGLPSGLKWATMNVGANSPSDYGQYFAWGETVQKYDFNENNSVTHNRTMNDISGNLRYDVARSSWGGNWRLPTKKEFEELKKNCTWVFTTQGGHNGFLVTGPNGRQIFFPFSGHYYGDSISHLGTRVSYWSSTPDDMGYDDDNKFAWGLDLEREFRRSIRNRDEKELFEKFYLDISYREYGHCVRPVTE